MLLYFSYLLAYLPLDRNPARLSKCEGRGRWAHSSTAAARPPHSSALWPFHLTTSQPTHRSAEWDRNNGRHYQGRPAYGADGGRMPHMVQAVSGLTT